jgi:hypothetical protein
MDSLQIYRAQSLRRLEFACRIKVEVKAVQLSKRCSID